MSEGWDGVWMSKSGDTTFHLNIVYGIFRFELSMTRSITSIVNSYNKWSVVRSNILTFVLMWNPVQERPPYRVYDLQSHHSYFLRLFTTQDVPGWDFPRHEVLCKVTTQGIIV